MTKQYLLLMHACHVFVYIASAAKYLLASSQYNMDTRKMNGTCFLHVGIISPDVSDIPEKHLRVEDLFFQVC